MELQTAPPPPRPAECILEGGGWGGMDGGVGALIYSLSLPLFLPLTQIYVQEEHYSDFARLDDRRARSCWAPAPGLDSGLACAVSRRAVRGGADPALRAPPRETDKVYTWFANGVQEAEKVCSKFTCQFAYSGKKFTLGLHMFCNLFTGSRKVHMSVCIQWQKFTLRPKCLHQRIQNSRKKLH